MTAKGLESLQSVGGNAYFDTLLSLDGLKSLKTVGGKVTLGMESASDLLDADRRDEVANDRNLGLR